MNRGLKHLCVLFTCLSVVMFSSILVMADENDEDINLPVDVEQEFGIEESDEDEPFIIDETGNGEDIEDCEDISICEDEITEDKEGIDDDDVVPMPDVITIDIDCKKSVIPGKDVVFSPSYGRSVNTTGVYRKQLTGVDAATYDILKDRFTDVAYGRLSSTEFVLSLDDLGFDNVFTAEELGIDYILDTDTLEAYPNLGNIIFDKVTCNITDILYRFIFDCPFESYWYDKTQYTGCYFTEEGMQLNFNPKTREFEAVYNGDIVYYFPVSSDYASSTYVVKSSEVNRALSAYNYANTIVEIYKNYSDLDKLLNYSQLITSLVDYNDAAASGSVPYGDPWQWVYVFDRKSNTNVVCEGYSKAFKLLCDLSDFENEDIYCILVTGLFTGGGTTGPHMWNVVSLGDGMNYIVDVTNCDTDAIGYPRNLYLQNYDLHNGDSNIITGNGWTATYSYYPETRNFYTVGAITITSAPLISAPSLNCTSNCGGVTISWSAIQGANQYEVYRQPEAGEWTYVGITSNNTFIDANPVIGENFYCLRCKDIYGNYMNLLEPISCITHKQINHTYVDDPSVDPDCTHTGLTPGCHCSVCGKVLVPQFEVPAWGHIEIIDAAVPATTTHTGLTEGSHCARCGEVIKEQEIIPILEPTELAISTQPADYTGPAGTTAIFVLVAAGDDLTYQWQCCKGSSWTNATQASARSTTLRVSISDNRDGWKYRCIVTDEYGNSVTSDEATLNVQQSVLRPIFLSQPNDYIGPVGTTATFNVVVEGEDLTYQWQCCKGTSWTNATQASAQSATLRVSITENRNGWKYRCIVTDGSGLSSTSDEAVLYIGPSIKSQPYNYTGPAGATATFNVVAEGNDLTYQWQYCKGTSWTNATQASAQSATLRVSITENRNGWKYRCIITDENGISITSDEAILNVGPKLISQPTDFSGPVGTTATFNVVAEGKDLTYQWQCCKGTSWTNATQASAQSATLRVSITENRNGWKYRCIITDENGISITSDEAILNVGPKLISQPTDFSGPVGTTATFNVVAEGKDLTYQWQCCKGTSWTNATQASAQSATLRVSITEKRDGWKYRCIVTDSSGNTVTSYEASLFIILVR